MTVNMSPPNQVDPRLTWKSKQHAGLNVRQVDFNNLFVTHRRDPPRVLSTLTFLRTVRSWTYETPAECEIMPDASRYRKARTSNLITKLLKAFGHIKDGVAETRGHVGSKGA